MCCSLLVNGVWHSWWWFAGVVLKGSGLLCLLVLGMFLLFLVVDAMNHGGKLSLDNAAQIPVDLFFKEFPMVDTIIKVPPYVENEAKRIMASGKAGSKIEAIRYIRSVMLCSLKDAKDFADTLPYAYRTVESFPTPTRPADSVLAALVDCVDVLAYDLPPCPTKQTHSGRFPIGANANPSCDHCQRLLAALGQGRRVLASFGITS